MSLHESFVQYADLIRGHYRKLPEHEVVSLIQSYQKALVDGDLKEQRRTQDLILKAYWPLLVKFTNKITYISSAVSKEDLVQEGALGLFRAMKTFNPELGFKFSTYAGFWIFQAIGRSQQKMEKFWKLPESTYEKYRKFVKSEALLRKSRGFSRTSEEIEKYCKDNDLEHFMFYELLSQPVSLSVDHHDEDDTLESSVADPSPKPQSEGLEAAEAYDQFIMTMFRVLNTDKATFTILSKRFGIFHKERSVSELAREYRTTQAKILKRLRNALYKIRDNIVL